MLGIVSIPHEIWCLVLTSSLWVVIESRRVHAKEEMMDTLTPEQRSERMSRIRHKDTKTELAVRRLTHGMGYRYRLHVKGLPGTPDMVFPSRRKVIFVHGCFWHGHDCRLGRMPKSRIEFWRNKISSNAERDERVSRELRALGWDVLVIWECQLRDMETVAKKIREFLDA